MLSQLENKTLNREAAESRLRQTIDSMDLNVKINLPNPLKLI
jgi:hypothetical protein